MDQMMPPGAIPPQLYDPTMMAVQQGGIPPESVGLDPSVPLQSPFSPGFAGVPTPPEPAMGNIMPDPVLMELLSGAMATPPGDTSLMRRERMGKVPKPTKGQVVQAIERDAMRYQDLLRRMARDLAMYRQHTSGVPSSFRQHREKKATSAAISNLVNRMSAIMSGGKITARAPWQTTDESKSSQIVEDWCQFILKQWIRRYAAGQSGNLVRDQFWYMFLHGVMCIRALPNVADEKFPYNIALMDPATCFPTFGADKMIRMSIKRRCTVGEAITDYGLDQRAQRKLVSKLGYDEFTSAEDYWDVEGDLTEYWDSWYRYVQFQDVEIMPITAHEYGRVPFVYITPVGEPHAVRTPMGQYYSPEHELGGGFTNFVTVGQDLEQKAVSIFHHLVNTHRLKEALTTLLYNEVEKAADPPTITYRASHLMGDDNPPLDLGRAGNNQRELNLERVEAVPTSPRPSDLAPLANQIGQEWAEGTIPPQGYGPELGNTSQGIGPETIFTFVREIALPYITGWEMGMSMLMEMCLDYYRDFIAPAGLMTIPEYTDTGKFSGQMNQLTIEDIDRVGSQVDINMKGSALSTMAQKVAMANQAIQAGLISQRFAMEEIMEYDNPEKMLGEIISEKAIQHQKMMEMFIIPQGFIQQGNPEFAKMWLNLVVAPQMASMMTPPMPTGPDGQPMPAPAPGGGMMPEAGVPSPSGGGELQASMM